jgi:hypothetical protein
MTWKATGSTALALGDRDREWDQEGARKRIFHWAGWEDNPSPAKAKRAFFAYNDAEPKELTAYKLPFADVVGGELKAMPRGLFAVAQMLRGARDGVDLPEPVLRSARRKVTTYYHKMGEDAPWEEPGGRKKMPGALTPAKRRKSEQAASKAARTRARRGTQSHGPKKMTAEDKKKRTRAAAAAARTRAKHNATRARQSA